MAWTEAEFAKMREDRARWLDEIASLEAGEPQRVSRRENGDVVDDRDEHLAHLRRNVAEIESIFAQNNESLD
jgi:hypothetical protein